MSFDYFDSLEDWELPAIPRDDPSEARRVLAEAFSDIEIELPLGELAPEQLGAMAPHVLVSWMHDYDLALSLFAVPAAKLSAALAAALKTANRMAWTYFELMIGDEKARAFARIDAATGWEFEDYLEDFEANVAGFGATVDASDRKCFAQYRVAYLESEREPVWEEGAFDKRFVATYSTRRCQ